MTDHRIGVDLHNLPNVLDGDLDRLLDALITTDQAERLAHLDTRHDTGARERWPKRRPGSRDEHGSRTSSSPSAAMAPAHRPSSAPPT